MFKWPLINDNITQKDKKVLSDFILNTNRLTNGPMVKELKKNGLNGWASSIVLWLDLARQRTTSPQPSLEN